MKVEVEVELEAELELEHGLQSLLMWTWGTLFINRSYKRFIIHQFINRFIMNSFTTAVSVL